MYDICMKGFVDGYYNWTAHGEAQVLENYDDQPAPVCLETPVAPGMRTQWSGYEQMNWDQRIVYDTVGPQFFSTHQEPELRVPVGPFLQRLYASPATAEHMTWHASHVTEEDSMCHPSDAEAWRHFDRTHPNFALEPRNIRLGLCIDGFAPHGQYGRTYSCWPVIITPYNLPPGMCMKSEYMFLSMVIPGPSNPKRLIDVYLQPLIDELLQLWHVGVRTHDHATNQAFMMRAALMWTVNDLPAYGMASGWSTAGIMGCPICMDDTSAFYLQHGRKRATLTAIDVSPTRSSVPEKQESLHKKSSGKKYCKA
ncbi:UNVERIFIED_CONTAM: hypothetical protein Sangu_0699500 [Sesamum angustifolium]|uniref:Uncharacterized protein n=1 Tax=Sesamum angustifolium TaxID=2727405 RepID=A0AAW2PSI3_9LAMI